MSHSENREIRWFVCHTKPKCEKRFAKLLDTSELEYYLPLCSSTRQYYNRQTMRNEIKRFTKPLFPSYVFCRLPLERKAEAYQRDYVVRLLAVENEPRFLNQLDSVKRLIEAGVELDLCPPLEKGSRVRITSGPLLGVEGVVQNPDNPESIVVTVDILQQGVATRIPRADLEPVEEE